MQPKIQLNYRDNFFLKRWTKFKILDCQNWFKNQQKSSSGFKESSKKSFLHLIFGPKLYFEQKKSTNLLKIAEISVILKIQRVIVASPFKPPSQDFEENLISACRRQKSIWRGFSASQINAPPQVLSPTRKK